MWTRTLTVLLPIQLLITLAPGPQTSMTAPKLENEAFASAMVEAATVMADRHMTFLHLSQPCQRHVAASIGTATIEAFHRIRILLGP